MIVLLIFGTRIEILFNGAETEVSQVEIRREEKTKEEVILVKRRDPEWGRMGKEGLREGRDCKSG